MDIDHVGLTVSDLGASTAFFVECLGWRVIRERPEYPAAYLARDDASITLWEVEDRHSHVPFDRRANVGLHHLALRLQSRAELERVHQRASEWPGVEVEFAPEASGAGPKMHSMIREPGGCRIEFVWRPAAP